MRLTPMGHGFDDPLELKGKNGSSVIIPNRTFLAPMAGVSDLPFRILCRGEGAGMVAMEMISAKALCYHNRNTASLYDSVEEERPVSLQLFGHEPEFMAEAARIVEENAKFDILDINMGCPVPKVFGNGDGSALMADPSLVEKITAAAVSGTTRPVTVKIRAGIDGDHLNAAECARAAEAGGASAVAVHGRTRIQYYSGSADRRAVASVVRAVKIPVIGNGDVKDGKSALAMFGETGCEAVMIGRAAQGNPWIFGKVRRYLRSAENVPEGEELPEEASEIRPAPEELKDMIRRHIELQKKYKPERVALQEMRKHVAWYAAGFPGASKLRAGVNMASSFEEVEELIESCI